MAKTAEQRRIEELEAELRPLLEEREKVNKRKAMVRAKTQARKSATKRLIAAHREEWIRYYNQAAK